MGDALTEARAAIAAEQARRDAPKCPETFTHPTGRVYTCTLPLGHTIERHDFGPAFQYTVNLRHAEALAAEVDRLTARVAELEHLEASQHKARARDVAGIVGWLRKEAVKKANTSEAAGNTGAGLTASIQYAELWFTADAIERGDWHDGTLPADPRDAERLNLLDYAGGLENTIENMLWNLGGVSSVCMGALDADFTFDESAARAALHDAVKLRREFLALRAAARAVLSLTGDEPMEEADAAMETLATAAGVPEGSST